MDNTDSTNGVAVATSAGPSAQRRQWPVLAAILALAVALLSLASLRGADSAAVTAAPVAQTNPLAAPLQQQLIAQQAAAPAAAGTPASSGTAYSASSPKASAKKEIMIMGYKFEPSTVTVKVGDTVTWINHDSAPHDVTVTEGPEKFKSPTLQKGESWSYTFKKVGKYSYYCTIHPDMKASVTAEGSSSTPPPSSPPSTPPTEPPADCTSAEVKDAFLGHIQGGHLQQTPGQQVTDILALDQWVKTHTVWIDSFLTPLLEGDSVGKEMLTRFWAHVDGGHLQLTPSEQVADILETDKWVKTHTVWVSSVLEPLLDQATC